MDFYDFHSFRDSHIYFYDFNDVHSSPIDFLHGFCEPRCDFHDFQDVHDFSWIYNICMIFIILIRISKIFMILEIVAVII